MNFPRNLGRTLAICYLTLYLTFFEVLRLLRLILYLVIEIALEKSSKYFILLNTTLEIFSFSVEDKKEHCEINILASSSKEKSGSPFFLYIKLALGSFYSNYRSTSVVLLKVAIVDGELFILSV